MSKALIIKGANFYGNRVDTVTIEDVVPCESISLSDSTLAFTAIGQTATLTATVSPSDTTDSVIWNTSDSNVVTVVDGVVTCVGVGTANVTASCGTQIATCSITATITIDADAQLTKLARRSIQSTDMSLNPPKDYIGLSAAGESGSGSNAARTRTYVSSDSTLGFYEVFTGSGYPSEDWYAIPIPANTSVIRLTTIDFDDRFNVVLVSGTEKATYNTSNKGARAVSDIVIHTSDTRVGTSYNFDISGYSGYDSFVFSIRAQYGNDESQKTNPVTITFM